MNLETGTPNKPTELTTRADRLAYLRVLGERHQKSAKAASNGHGQEPSHANGHASKRLPVESSQPPSPKARSARLDTRTAKEIQEKLVEGQLRIPPSNGSPHDDKAPIGDMNGIQRHRVRDRAPAGDGYLLDCGRVLGDLSGNMGTEIQMRWGPTAPRHLYDYMVPTEERGKFRDARSRERVISSRLTAAREFVNPTIALGGGSPVGILYRAVKVFELFKARLGGVGEIRAFVAELEGTAQTARYGLNGWQVLVLAWNKFPPEIFSEGDVELPETITQVPRQRLLARVAPVVKEFLEHASSRRRRIL